MERRGDSLKNLEGQLKRIKDLAERPYGANIPLDLDQIGLLIDVLFAIRSGPKLKKVSTLIFHSKNL